MSPAILLNYNYGAHAPTFAPLPARSCPDCGATDNVGPVERWNAETRSWYLYAGCCGAERDELGLPIKRQS
jgi:hypothetical protein